MFPQPKRQNHQTVNGLVASEKTFLIRWHFGGGGVRIVGTYYLRKRQNTHHPQFAPAMLIFDLVGVVRGIRGLLLSVEMIRSLLVQSWR